MPMNRADWREVARIVLGLNVEKDPDRSKRGWESHLAGAKWMTETGYRYCCKAVPLTSGRRNNHH